MRRKELAGQVRERGRSTRRALLVGGIDAKAALRDGVLRGPARLLPTAVGKDFAGWPLYAGAAPSHTGYQLSLGGLFGVTLGQVEGLEVNMLGLVAGIDLARPAVKLPGWGRLALGG